MSCTTIITRRFWPARRDQGALQHEQIGEILNFRLFGNKRGYLTLENLPVGDIPPTPPSREQLNKPDESSERLLLQATALLGEPIGYLQESDGCIVNNFFRCRRSPERRTPTASTPNWICTPKMPSTPWYRTIWCCSACARTPPPKR